MSNRGLRRLRRLGLGILLACASSVSGVLAQNENETVGFQTNHLFESGVFGENVDIMNGGLTLTVPIGQRYQVNQNLGIQLAMTYTSKIWDTSRWNEPGGEATLAARGPMGTGFGLHLGRIYMDAEFRPVKTPDISQPIQYKTQYVWYFVTPDGNQHELPGSSPDTTLCASGNLPRGITTDTTYYSASGFDQIRNWDGEPDAPTVPSLRVSTPDGLIYTFGQVVQVKDGFGQRYYSGAACPDGSDALYRDYNRAFGGWYVTLIEDSHSPSGVTITDTRSSRVGQTGYAAWVEVAYEPAATRPGYEHAIKGILDSAGRKIDFVNDCQKTGSQCAQTPGLVNNPTNRFAVRTQSISLPAFGGSGQIAPNDAARAVYTFTYDYLSKTNLDGSAAEAANYLRTITYPAFSNLAGNQSPYTMTFGYNLYGELETRVLPTGASVNYYWDYYRYTSSEVNQNGVSPVTGITRQLVRKQVALGAVGPGTAFEWTYAREFAGLDGTPYTNPRFVTIKDPLGNETVYYYRSTLPNPSVNDETNFEDGYAPEWDDGLNDRIEYYQGNGTGRRLLRTERRDYDADTDLFRFGFPARGKRNVRMSRQVTVHHDDEGRSATVSNSDWDGVGHWRMVRETGSDIEGSRITRTVYLGSDPSRFLTREVTDGQRVLSRTDNKYSTDGYARLLWSIDRAILPARAGTAPDTTAQAGDVKTCYRYDAVGRVSEKEITDRAYCSTDAGYTPHPHYLIRYGWQAGGYLASKELLDWGLNRYYPWKAIDRSRDGNTGLIFQTRDTAGIQTTYTYDALGRIVEIIPPSPEFRTQVQYADIRRTSVRQGDPAVMRNDYACSAASGNYIMTCYDYDLLGRLVTTRKRPYDTSRGIPYQTTCQDVMGRTTYAGEWTWLVGGQQPYQCAGGTRPPGTDYDYSEPSDPTLQDPFGRVRKMTAADGQVTEMRYFGQSSEVTVRGIRGLSGSIDATTTYFRDGWGRLLGVVAPAGGGANASYAYDLRDNLVEVSLQDKSTLYRQTRAFEYDALNRLRSSTNPESGTVVVTGYDPLGNVTEQVDASGNRMRSVYDGAGRLVEAWRRDYQAPGEATPAEVRVVLNSYDEGGVLGPTCLQSTSYACSGGRLTRTESRDDTGAWVSTRELYYAGLNGRISSERNLFDGWTGTSPLVPVGYSYNNFGLASLLTYPEGQAGLGGSLSLSYTYSNGSLTKATDLATGLDQATATYNAAGGYESVVSNGGVTTRIPAEVRNRPDKITVGKGTYDPVGDAFSIITHYKSKQYQYDGAGNISQIGDNQYRYDAASRLVQAEVYPDNVYWKQTFQYDDFGNLKQKVLWDNLGNQAAWDIFTASDLITKRNTNRILFRQGSSTASASFYTYDARGNLTGGSGRSYEYDGRNRMVLARSFTGDLGTDVARYAYDAAANRVRKDDQTRDLMVFYVRDAQGRLLSEFRRRRGWSDLTPEWSKSYIYLGDRLVGLRENTRPSPPAGLKATTRLVGSGAEVRLSWSANPAWEGVTGYKVYRSPNAPTPTWTLLTTVASPNHTDATSTPGISYLYSLRADKGRTESYRSVIALLTAGDSTPPSVPQNLQARPGDRRVDLTWTPNLQGEGVVGYHVYWNGGGTHGIVRITAAPVEMSYTHLNLTNGQVYKYALSAVDVAGLESPQSPLIQVTPVDRVPPGPPRVLVARPDCAGEVGIRVEWELNDAAEDVARYLLYREPPFDAPGPKDRGLLTSYADTEVLPGASYTYWVEALDAAGNRSPGSVRAAAAAADPPGTVPAPGPPSAESGDGQVRLRVALPKDYTSTKAMRLHRKLNAEVACESYDRMAEFSASIGRCTTGQNCPGGSGCPAGLSCSSPVPGVSGICIGQTCGGSGDCPSGQDCRFAWGEPGYRDFVDGDAPNNAAYDYVLTAVDAQGRESPFSPSVIGTSVAPPLNYAQCVDNMPAPTPYGGTCAGTQLNRQFVMRWQHPPAAQYQPLSATNASGALGYLEGYRVYAYDQDLRQANREDMGSLVPVKIDFGWAYCQGHPDIVCRTQMPGDCPAGDTCVLPSAGDPTASAEGQCPALGGACIQDGDCLASSSCRNAHPDPYLVTSGDGRQFASYPGGVTTDCVTVKAVYKIYANGNWLTVESAPTASFDATTDDPTFRCLQPMPDICTYTGPFCPQVVPLPPTPAAPVATSASPGEAPGEVRVTWQAPSGGSGIAGYHLYVIELDNVRYHFTRPAPFAILPATQTEYLFSGLASRVRSGVDNRLQFRVATYDATGRISDPSPPSETVVPLPFAEPLPPPVSLKTPLSLLGRFALSVDQISVSWIAGGSYADFKGYRVYRSTTEGGPYCALLKVGAGNPPGIPVCANDLDGTPGSPNATSTDVTTTSTLFSDGAVARGVDYHYVVTALTNTGQESRTSLEIAGRALTKAAQPLTPPAFFRAWAPDDQPGIALRFCPSPASEGVTGYRLYRATGRAARGGPYAPLVDADIPPACLDGEHQCVISMESSVSTLTVKDAQQSGCVRGIGGTCGRILDLTVGQPAPWELLETQLAEFVYSYVVTAIRQTTDPVNREESGYSVENTGWPNYCDPGTGACVTRYDPDNFPETPCKMQIGSLGSGVSAEPGGSSTEEARSETMAPYLSVAGKPGPPPKPPTETPAALPRFVYFHLDHLGSPRVITDSAGAVVSKHHYLPFGEELPVQAMNGSNTRQFTGHERDDESGLDYMVVRHYGSSLNRFLSVDPDGANPTNPQSWNKYAYALGNPIKFLDGAGRYAQIFLGFMQRETTSERRAGLNRTARQLQGEGVTTGTTKGPGILPGSLGRRSVEGGAKAGESGEEHLEFVGFSRGAIAARDAAEALNGTRNVDLLLMVDPELRSNLSVPSNVKLAIHVSNGSAKATAQDPSKTTVINLDVPGGTSHMDMDNPDSPQMGFARDAARLADEGKLTPEKAEELARGYGLRIQQ
jgi:RHS repeat-associated protein